MNLILYEDRDFIIADKPHGLPTVPLKRDLQQETLLKEVSVLYPEVLHSYGRNYWEGGALHRLDTDTSGLVIFARNQAFYDYLFGEQLNDRFVKQYRADTDGDTEEREISSYFRAFGEGRKRVKVELNPEKADSPVLYRTTIEKKESGVYSCTITRGFRHQIRAHLAYLGCPIKGDRLYNPENPGSVLLLDCQSVSFGDFTFHK
ncbi:MAG: RNA pseudouridine synthase [Sphaerochaetaceae bacterium]|nr:RNA pseudouridine synthase [Sphaerochaetaceae bacterium]